jgi:hypothetical protein
MGLLALAKTSGSLAAAGGSRRQLCSAFPSPAVAPRGLGAVGLKPSLPFGNSPVHFQVPARGDVSVKASAAASAGSWVGAIGYAQQKTGLLFASLDLACKTL